MARRMFSISCSSVMSTLPTWQHHICANADCYFLFPFPTHRNTETQHLLHLELDGGLHVIHLLLEVIGVSDHGGELSRLVNT